MAGLYFSDGAADIERGLRRVDGVKRRLGGGRFILGASAANGLASVSETTQAGPFQPSILRCVNGGNRELLALGIGTGCPR